MKELKSTNQFINSALYFFHMSQNFCHTVKKKQLRKDKKKNEYCSMVILFEKIALWYSLLQDFHMRFPYGITNL